ncbi:MAG: spondin domain-containing protein [candidate division KSB1 bacterium]|nr:spondin domain-containing protein [candidate division KSB1 bacterium]
MRIYLWITMLSVFSTQALAGEGQRTVFRVEIENVSRAYPFSASGVFNTPVGADAPAPIGPGGAYEFSFSAAPGAKLSLATMFVPSNDLFYAPSSDGIALYDSDGMPVSGDVTDQIMLWDAGTEANEEPGVGPNQPQRQAGANTGAADADNRVRLVNDGFAYPSVIDVIKITIDGSMAPRFTVRIENVSTDSTLKPSDGSMQPVPLTPGVWVVHTQPGALFMANQPNSGNGLEMLAEDGNPSGLAEKLAMDTGLTVPLSPGVWVLHSQPAPLFSANQPDRGLGLAAIAEDGNPGMLAEALLQQEGVVKRGIFLVPVGASGPAPIGPGGKYRFYLAAMPGEALSFASMFVPSNDLFYAPDEMGIALFDANGNPVAGDVTDRVMLWDAGSEANEEPGLGPNQVQRQGAPNTGPDDPDNRVRLVDDGYTYPPVADVIRITVTPVEPVPMTLRIENVSTDMTLKLADGSTQPVPLSPGVWSVHGESGPIFMSGSPDRGLGLEAIAEDGNPASLAEALMKDGVNLFSGVFNTPVGASGPAPIGPGGAYEFTIHAVPGMRFSFVSMFVPSNDLFFAPDENGIPLFDGDGNVMQGDVTEYVQLWDAGTEMNEPPGAGPNQVQRQSGPNTGTADPDSTVRLVNDGYAYPAVNEVIRVTVSPMITGIEEGPTSAPGTFALHQNYPNPFNPETVIQFTVPETRQVRIAIYNLLGQEMVELVRGVMPAGTHRILWNGLDRHGNPVPSGVYLYELKAGDFQTIRKMTLLR